jgi:hypothetical protein
VLYFRGLLADYQGDAGEATALLGETAVLARDSQYRPDLARALIALGRMRRTLGEFKKGRGEFYSQETLNGRPIFVRFVISETTPDSCRFEQAFSADEGKMWEVNWIATDTRIPDAVR